MCYHGGPAGTEYENMAYADAVQVMRTAKKEEAQFAALAKGCSTADTGNKRPCGGAGGW